MAYRVEAGNLSEKVKREVATIVALDEETWSVMTVGQVAPSGEIVEEDGYCHIRDFTAGELYYTPSWPVEIPLGHEVYGRAVGRNTNMAQKQNMKITAELIDPDGIAVGTESETGVVSGGYIIVVSTDRIILDKPGTWKLHVVLEGEVV